MQPTFKSMRRDGAIKRGEANAVRLEDIHEEPGFNELARDYDADDVQAIAELAAFIKAGGVYPALEVRPRVEGGVWLVDGHLRSRALRLLDAAGDLHSSERLHHPPEDDDRSAVTFWLPKSRKRRLELADTFRRMALEVELAPS